MPHQPYIVSTSPQPVMHSMTFHIYSIEVGYKLSFFLYINVSELSLHVFRDGQVACELADRLVPSSFYHWLNDVYLFSGWECQLAAFLSNTIFTVASSL